MIESRIVAALLNAAWQSAVLTAFAAAALRLLGRTSASVRCAVWCAVLAVVVALPLVDAAAQRSVSAPTTARSSAEGRTVATRVTSASRAVTPRVELTRPAAVAPPDVAAIVAAGAGTLALAIGAALGRAGEPVFWLWIAGVAVCAVRLGYGLRLIALMRRGLEPLDGDWLDARCRRRRGLSVAAGERVAIPCLIGLRRPTIVIPRPLVDGLRTEDLRRIVLHEASHAQRYDDWVNLFVQVARAVLFFNPVVHLIAARIGVEREIACDDRVIELSGDRLVYAECLSTLARAVSTQRAHAVPGFFGGRAQIVVRIEQLLDRAHDSSSRLGRKSVAAIAASAIFALLLAQVGFPVVAATTVAAAIDAVQAPLNDVARTIPHAGATVAAVVPRARAMPKRSVVPKHEQIDAHPKTAVVVSTHLYVRRNLAVLARTVSTKAAHEARVISVETSARVSSPETVTTVAVRTSVALASSPSVVASVDQSHDFVDELAAAGYRGLSVDQLIKLRDHGVDGEYLAGLRKAGYTGLSVDDVVRLRDHGVDPAYIGAMRRAGYGGVGVEDLIRLRDHGVDAETARALTASQHGLLRTEDLIMLRDHGVDSSYANALAALGVAVPTDQLVKLRDHGVDPSFIDSMRRAGYAGLSADQLIELRDHGVDAAFIEHIRHYFSDGHKPTIGDLVRLRDSGI